MKEALLASVDNDAITPAMKILGPRFDSIPARTLLLAIALQESRATYRKQLNNGPARGLWQFEKGGGVRGVLSHKSSQALALSLCDARKVLPLPTGVWEAMATDDVLAAGFARLLIFTDPKPLPLTAEDGWSYYVRTWRPGKPHRETWDEFYKRAGEFYAA